MSYFLEDGMRFKGGMKFRNGTCRKRGAVLYVQPRVNLSVRKVLQIARNIKIAACPADFLRSLPRGFNAVQVQYCLDKLVKAGHMYSFKGEGSKVKGAKRRRCKKKGTLRGGSKLYALTALTPEQ